MPRSCSISFLAAAIVLVAACLPAVEQPAGDAGQQSHQQLVDAVISPLITQYDIPGMAVAISHHGRVSFYNFGVADRASATPVSEHTLFEIGSVSKTVNAALTSYAHVSGVLSLQDHPSAYLPELAGSALDGATLMHLATYTPGGLPLQFPDTVTDHVSMLAYYQQWQPDAAPGAVRRYSNPSIGLMGYLTGVALGEGYDLAVQNRLFSALAMHSSYIRVPDTAMSAYAWGYNAAGQAMRVNPGMFDGEAYGVKTTAADFIRFVQANMQPDSLPEPWASAIRESHRAYYQLNAMHQALAWEWYDYPLTLDTLLAGSSPAVVMQNNLVVAIEPARLPPPATVIHKTGSTNGFGAYVMFVPAQDFGIVLLANRNYPNEARISAAWQILEEITGH
jgi:beta-lactamase class C